MSKRKFFIIVRLEEDGVPLFEEKREMQPVWTEATTEALINPLTEDRASVLDWIIQEIVRAAPIKDMVSQLFARAN